MAYAKEAWDIVQKYLPSHYMTQAGPCCTTCARMFLAVTYALDKNYNDTTKDATDFAHPAWWRGQDHAFNVMCKQVNDILDGVKPESGTCKQPWQDVRQRLYDICTLLGIADLVISQTPFDIMSRFHSPIMQWYQIRKEYFAKRLVTKEKTI